MPGGRSLLRVIFLQPFAEGRCLHLDDAIVARVVVLPASEYLAAEQVLLQAILPAGEGLTHYEFEEGVKLMGFPQMSACEQDFEFSQNLFGTGYAGAWIGNRNRRWG